MHQHAVLKVDGEHGGGRKVSQQDKGRTFDVLVVVLVSVSGECLDVANTAMKRRSHHFVVGMHQAPSQGVKSHRTSGSCFWLLLLAPQSANALYLLALSREEWAAVPRRIFAFVQGGDGSVIEAEMAIIERLS